MILVGSTQIWQVLPFFSQNLPEQILGGYARDKIIDFRFSPALESNSNRPFLFLHKACKREITTNYRGSPTSTVSTSTNSTCTHFQKAPMKFHLYDFASKSSTCTNSTNTIFHHCSPTNTKFNGIQFLLVSACFENCAL